ncbi:MAG: hypothetical protein KDD51_15080 [Bdellovibrionales bacterium]|nr:hypothetical protein [Bdellovibrionales bacterium]
MRRRGSLVLEASFCLLPTVFVVVLNLELARRATLEASLHYATFEWVRGWIYGLSEIQSRKRVGAFLLKAYWPGVAPHPLQWKIRRNARRQWVGTLHYRYRMFLEWPGRHHFEVTRQCILCC